MFRVWLYTALAAVLPVLAGVSRAVGEPTTGFIDKVHKGADGKGYKYVVYVPKSYKGDKEYPVVRRVTV
jgi:hypothetical protein